MPTRNVSLTDELDRFILAKVHSGRYENASEVVRTALRQLELQDRQYDLRMKALDAELAKGMANPALDRDGPTVFKKLREKYGLPPRSKR